MESKDPLATKTGSPCLNLAIREFVPVRNQTPGYKLFWKYCPCPFCKNRMIHADNFVVRRMLASGWWKSTIIDIKTSNDEK